MALNFGANIGANLSVPLTQSYGAETSNSANQASGSGYSNTDAAAAREWSAKQAEIAFNRQKELMKMEMDYNSKEAQIARDWNESMANSVYTRSVKNMKEAGINPILAANMGLSGASVGSAQTASIGGASAPVAQGFMDSSSAWNNQSSGESHSSGSSESGLVTAIKALGEMASAALGAVNAGNTLNVFMKDMEKAATTVAEKGNPASKETTKDNYQNSGKKTGNWMIDNIIDGVTKSIKGQIDTQGGMGMLGR